MIPTGRRNLRIVPNIHMTYTRTHEWNYKVI